MTYPNDDPFAPQVPHKDDLGRLVLARRLVAGWQCRWCPNLLTATPSGGVLCLDCDRPHLETTPDA